MPIYDQGYRRYEARAPLRQVRFWPITREALRILLAKRAFVVLFLASFVPFIVAVGVIYASTRFPQLGAILPEGGRLFGMFLNFQVLPVVLLSIFAGAGLVANDLRAGAMLVYLSRPLTRRDYVMGKLGVLLLLNLAVTLAPGLLLYLLALGLAPEQYARWSLAWIGPAIVVQALLVSLVVGLLLLAVSALSRSARVAGLAFVGLWIGVDIVRGVLTQIADRREAEVLSIQQDLRAVGNALFGIVERASSLPVVWPALSLAAVAVGCLFVLRSRVRAVEIVK